MILTSEPPAVVRPVKERLPLTAMTADVSRLTARLYLGHVPHHRFPALDLTIVIRMTTAHIVAAVPLEPAAWIVWMNPSLALPFDQWLAGMDAKEIERRFGHPLVRKFCPDKPCARKFVATVIEV